jgi:signal transduction histidine kinase
MALQTTQECFIIKAFESVCFFDVKHYLSQRIPKLFVMEPQDLYRQLESIHEASKAFMKNSSLESAVQEALGEVLKQLNVQVASIFMFSKDGVIKRIGISGIDNQSIPIDNHWLSNESYKPGESFSGKVVPDTGLECAFGKPYYSNDIFNEYPEMSNRVPYLEKLGKLSSGITVPLNGLNRTFGALRVLNKKDQGQFTKDDVYWLMIVGTNFANFVIELKRKQKLKLINRLIELLVSLESTDQNFDLKKLYQFVADEITSDWTSFKVCIIRLANENEDLEIRGSSFTNDVSWVGREDGSVKSGSQIVGEVYTTGEPQFIANVDDFGIDNFNNKSWIQSQGFKSFACLPLSVKGKCVGTVSVYAKYPYFFFENDKYFLQNITFLVAAMIARVRVVNELRKVRKELDEEKKKLLNASLAVRYDSLLQGILHQYKNELLDLHETLEIVSSNKSKTQKEKEQIISSKKLIEKRIEEIRSEFTQDDPIPVNINKLLKDTAKSFIKPALIDLTEKYDINLPIIEVDEQKIQDVISNLISNAVSAIDNSEKKNGKIIISTETTNIDNIKYIQIVVEDNGIGISNENREKIFEQGFTTRKELGGTGMGLYVTREILIDLGGEIHVHSRVGKGTKFFVRIPFKRYLNLDKN